MNVFVLSRALCYSRRTQTGSGQSRIILRPETSEYWTSSFEIRGRKQKIAKVGADLVCVAQNLDAFMHVICIDAVK